MFILRLRVLIIVIAIFGLAGFSFPKSENVIRQFIEDEKKEIEQVVNGEVENVYFVSLFEGYIPIPTRYVLSNKSSDTSRFISRPLTYRDDVFENPSEYSLTRDLSGDIVIGEKGDKKSNLSNKKRQAHKKISEKKFNCYGLSVIVKEYALPGKDKVFNKVRIENETEYMEIVDENPNLWRSLLRVHYALKKSDKEKLEGCSVLD